MEPTFRMYKQFRSSCFDFFQNDLEPAQTKGLGYLLSQSKNARDVFCDLLKPYGMKLKEKDYAWDIVCELYPEEKKGCRLDILVRLLKNNEPCYAFLLEAKSVDRKIDFKSVEGQLDAYLGAFSAELKPFDGNVYGVILTHHTILTQNDKSKYIYLSWEQIIQGLMPRCDKDFLIKDYIYFILNIKNMETKFYTDEVLSIAAGKTIDMVEELRIYACKENRFKKTPLFIAFRRNGGGEMNRLYRIKENILSINRKNDASLDALEQKFKGIKGKIQKLTNDWIEDVIQVIILDDEEKDIVLPHPVKPEHNNVDKAGWSYLLSEFFQEPNEDGFVVLKKSNNKEKLLDPLENDSDDESGSMSEIMKTYKISFGVRGTGVQLMKLDEDQKNNLLEEDLDDIYMDYVDEHDCDFYHEEQYITSGGNRYHLIVEDEDGNTIYETEDFSDIKDATFDENGNRVKEFNGIEDGYYLTRTQTLKGCAGEGEFELPDNKKFDPSNLYVIQDSFIDDELLEEPVFPMYEMHYQLGEKPNLTSDIKIDFDPNGDDEEQYWTTSLMKVENGNEWTDLQEEEE